MPQKPFGRRRRVGPESASAGDADGGHAESGSVTHICHSIKHRNIRVGKSVATTAEAARWITAKDGTHYEMYGNFVTPDLDAIRCQVERHTLVFCGFSHDPG